MNPIRIAILVVATLVVLATTAYMAGFRIGGSTEIDRIYEAPPEESVRVLFVGNSHTFRFDVPGQLQRLGEAANTPFWVEQEAEGGATLEQHWKAKTARRRITEGRWDFVVLQEQSMRPAQEPAKFIEYAARFSDLARRQGATPVIYATWARAQWNELYAETAFTPATLRAGLERSFRDAEIELEAKLAPVGAAWLSFRRKNPAQPLHSDDGNHATVAGAYLAACVLYGVLADQDVSGNDFAPDAVGPELASALQKQADRSHKDWARQWRDRRTPAPTRGQTSADAKEDSTTQRSRSALEALRQEREAEVKDKDKDNP